MIKRLVALATLTAIYRYLRRPYKDHPFYKVGIIDENGDMLVTKKEMTPEQKKEYGYINLFVYKIKRILDKNKIFRYSLIAAVTSAMFLKENEESQIYLYNGEYAIPLDPNILKESNTLYVKVATESGEKLVNRNELQKFDLLEEIANTTANVAMPEKPLTTRRRKKKDESDPTDTQPTKED